MRAFQFQLRTRYLFGPGSFTDAGKEIKKTAGRVLLVCGPSARRLGILQTLSQLLDKEGVEFVVFDKVMANPLVSVVDEGGKLAADSRVQAVVALGGGSVMDAAKGMAIVARNGGSIWDYVFINRTVRESLPVIAIPTLSATGSESNHYGVVTHDTRKEKISFICDGATPVLALIDPRLTLSVPPEHLRNGAVDIIAHSLESFFSSRDFALLNDNFSLALVRTIVDITPAILADPGNEDLRSVFAWSSTLALNGLNDAGREGPYTMHTLEHPMSGLFNIAHGLGLAVLLPNYFEFFIDEKAAKLISLGQQVFNLHNPSPQDALSALRSWLLSIGRLLSLQEAGIPAHHIPDLCDQVFRINANRHGNISGPRQLSPEDVRRIFSLCTRPQHELIVT